MSQPSPKNDAREQILVQLRHPLKLRIVLSVAVVVVWYLGFFMPLVADTDATSARVVRERKRVATAREIESLKKRLAPHQGLIPAGSDISELMQSRDRPPQVVSAQADRLQPRSAQGPWSLRGDRHPVGDRGTVCRPHRLSGLGREQRTPIRIDSIKIDPNQQNPGRLKAQMTLLSLAEKPAAPPKAKPPAGKSQSSKTAE